jgi:hypothetical protein
MLAVFYLIAGTAAVVAISASLGVLRSGQSDVVSRAIVPISLTAGWSLVITNPLAGLLADAAFDGRQARARRRKSQGRKTAASAHVEPRDSGETRRSRRLGQRRL